MQTAYQLPIDEVLTKDHDAIKKAFIDAHAAPTRAARRDELRFVKQKIKLHETFENRFYYQIASDCLGKENPILAHAIEEHHEIERLLNDASDDAGAKLETVIVDHVDDEEKYLFPAVRNKIDTTTAQVLGRHYEQISGITDFTAGLIKDVRASFPHLSRSVTILMTDFAPNFETSAGSVELVLQSTNHALYSHLSLLGGLISAILQPLAKKGYDASVLLCRGGKVCTAFISCPNIDSCIVESDDFDPSHPMSAIWLNGKRIVSFDDLPCVLSRMSSTVVFGARTRRGSSHALSNLSTFVSLDACRNASPTNAAFALAFYAELPDGPFRQYLEALTCLPDSGRV